MSNKMIGGFIDLLYLIHPANDYDLIWRLGNMEAEALFQYRYNSSEEVLEPRIERLSVRRFKID